MTAGTLFVYLLTLYHFKKNCQVFFRKFSKFFYDIIFSRFIRKINFKIKKAKKNLCRIHNYGLSPLPPCSVMVSPVI